MSIENELDRLRTDINKIQRVLDQSICVGIVKSVDTQKGTASVTIKGGEIWSDLQVVTQRAGANGRAWWMPAEGEMVIILTPWGAESLKPVIWGSLYTGAEDAQMPSGEATNSQLCLYPETKSLKIQVGEAVSISLTGKSIECIVGNSSIFINKESISLKSAKINLEAGSVNVSKGLK